MQADGKGRCSKNKQLFPLLVRMCLLPVTENLTMENTTLPLLFPPVRKSGLNNVKAGVCTFIFSITTSFWQSQFWAPYYVQIRKKGDR